MARRAVTRTRLLHRHAGAKLHLSQWIDTSMLHDEQSKTELRKTAFGFRNVLGNSWVDLFGGSCALQGNVPKHST